jgi:hypothetical protein
MGGVLAARPAEFFGLQAIGMFFLVFSGGVVAIFALTTLQSNNFAHFPNSFLEEGAGLRRPTS